MKKLHKVTCGAFFAWLAIERVLDIVEQFKPADLNRFSNFLDAREIKGTNPV